MKKAGILFFLLLYCFFFTITAKAEQEYTEEMITQQIDKLHLYDIDEQIEKIWQKQELPSFGECIKKSILEGKGIDIADLLTILYRKLAGEITTQIAMVKKMLFIILLSAILKNINQSFYNKSVGELGFYVCYMVLIVVITATFYSQTDMVHDAIKNVEIFFKAMMPVFMTLSFASGGYGEFSKIRRKYI